MCTVWFNIYTNIAPIPSLPPYCLVPITHSLFSAYSSSLALPIPYSLFPTAYCLLHTVWPNIIFYIYMCIHTDSFAQYIYSSPPGGQFVCILQRKFSL